MANSTSIGPPTHLSESDHHRQREREESREVLLQGYVEELRQAIREIASRQLGLEKTLKNFQGTEENNRLAIDQFREESITLARARAVDDNRTKQQITEMEQRLDDTMRPIRSLQAQVGQLVEASTERTDDTDEFEQRLQNLTSAVDHVRAIGERGSKTIHDVRDSTESLHRDIEALRKEIMINEDAIRIVEQDSHRRTDEIVAASSDVDGRIDELRSELRHVFDLIDEARRSTEHLDPAIEELQIRDGELDQAIIQVGQQAGDRHDTIVERIDEVQEMAEEQFADLRQAQDQRLEHLDQKIDEVADRFQALDERISAVAEELNELRIVDDAIRRDLWNLHEQRVRLRLEQAQQELEQFSGMRRMDRAETSTSPLAIPRPGDR